MDKPEGEHTAGAISKTEPPTPTDDESIITTSTESDTVDPWTMVTDRKSKSKNKKAKSPKEKDKAKGEKRIEGDVDGAKINTADCSQAEDVTDAQEQRMEPISHESEEQKSETPGDDQATLSLCPIGSPPDALGDELSDGISIISESESPGRASPQIDERVPFSDLSYKFCFDNDSLVIPSTPNSPIDSSTAIFKAFGEQTKGQLQQQQQALRQRRHQMQQSQQQQQQKNTPKLHGSSSDDDSFAGDDEQSLTTQPSASLAVSRSTLGQAVKKGLSGVFYVCVALSILAFIGKLRYPEWRPLAPESSQSVAELEQKLVDMELQNNLMRAEIDLLSRQVNYLSSLNDKTTTSGGGRGDPTLSPMSQQQQQQKYQSKPHQRSFPSRERERSGSKSFKAWSGNGDSIDVVEIDKHDLKRPHQCQDGRFVEVAGMCIENKPYVEPLIAEVNKVMEEAMEKSPLLRTILDKENAEATAEGTAEAKSQWLPQNPHIEVEVEAEKKEPSQVPAHPKGEREQRLRDSRENLKKFKCPNAKKCHDRGDRDDSQDPDSGDEGAKRRLYGKKNSRENSKERYNKSAYKVNDDDDSKESKFADNSRERNFKKSSKEHSKENSRESSYKMKSHSDEYPKDKSSKEAFKKVKYTIDESKERSHKNDRPQFDNSHERYDSKERRKSSGERYKKDGHWHEKLMQHREHARLKNERERNERNWYIERGNSREQMRHDYDGDDDNVHGRR